MDATILPFQPKGAPTRAAPRLAARFEIGAAASIAAAELEAIGRAGGEARDVVIAAVGRWISGQPLDAREQRLVDLVLTANRIAQMQRLCHEEGSP